MRENCSAGLHGMSLQMKKDYFSGKISKINKISFMLDMVYRIRHWEKMVANDYNYEDLLSPIIGNPYGIELDNKFIRVGSFYCHYYAIQLAKLLRKKDDTKKSLLEIGGGYGLLAYFLSKNTNNLSYIDLDLPENMALTAYYLMNAYPNKNFLLYGEGSLSKENILNHDFIIMPNFVIRDIPDNICDVSFNSYSLAEMPRNTISEYITQIMRLTKSFFMHVNHTKNSLVIADDFGVDKNIFDILYKAPAMWNYGRNIKMDEYEFLYRRIK